MAGQFPQEWYLELDGKKAGPFSPEQILGLLADGEIPEGLTVIPAAAEGDSVASGLGTAMSAAAMRDAYFQDDRLPSAMEPSKEKDWESSPSIPMAREEVDPEAAANLATTRRLFDLFQSAKDRRDRFAPTSTPHASAPEDSASLWQRWSKSPIAAAVAASVIVVFGVRFWGGIGTSKESASRDIARSSPVSAPTPLSSSTESKKPASTRPLTAPSRIQNNWKPPTRRAPVASSVSREESPRPRAFQRQAAEPRPQPRKPVRAPQRPRPAQNAPQNWADPREQELGYEERRDDGGNGSEYQDPRDRNTEPYSPPEGFEAPQAPQDAQDPQNPEGPETPPDENFEAPEEPNDYRVE